MPEDENLTPEKHVAAWLAKWGVEWLEERARQLVGDLRLLFGWGEHIDGPGSEAT